MPTNNKDNNKNQGDAAKWVKGIFKRGFKFVFKLIIFGIIIIVLLCAGAMVVLEKITADG